MSVELKPCPNCGGQPKIHKTHKKFYVECDGDCWTQTGKHSYQEDAVKEWNTQIAVAKEGRQMTDHNFTDEEIKTGLRCLSGEIILCKFCAFSHLEDRGFACKKNVANAALALINRQKAEIERLNTVHADMTESLRLAAEANKDMQAEIKKLKGSRNRWKQIATDFDKASRETEKEIERLTTLAELGNMRANDYREMRNKLKKANAEIESLKKIGDDKTSEILRHATAIGELHKQLETARAEAIKEFAQRLKSDLGRIPQHQFTRSQVEWSINTFVKEMAEGNK